MMLLCVIVIFFSVGGIRVQKYVRIKYTILYQVRFLLLVSISWTAGRVLKVDNQNHRLYLYGYGREKGINPNYAFLYGVDFNGKHLKCLTPENASHNVSINPTIDLFVDNYSRIDTIPQVCVRSMDGKLLSTIEHIDVSKLLSYGWKYPEQFTVKAADGITNLYGIMP